MKQQVVENHSRTKLRHSADTPNGAKNQVSATTCSSMGFPNNTKSKPWVLLLRPFIMGDFQD
jgi:hypothetical protein